MVIPKIKFERSEKPKHLCSCHHESEQRIIMLQKRQAWHTVSD